MNTTMPQPSARLLTRVVLPMTLVGASLAALAWTGWNSLVPVPDVDVIPVSVRAAGSQVASGPGAPREGAAVQAPGWVEPSPFPTLVPALLAGTVRSVDVLEGQRVESGQPVAHLIDDEARIAVKLAEAAHAEAQARVDEMKDELARKARLVESGAASAGEVARLRLRVQAMDASVAASAAELELRRLQLDRTVVKAPAAGVVMARLAVPGMMVGTGEGKAIVELYDPARLQVRADVPLADAGRITIGDRAEIALDVLPGRVFRGEVIRMVHQADIAKNTVQAKVRIDEPAPELKPDMLARVKVFPKARGPEASTSGRAAVSTIWAPEGSIIGRGAEAAVLVIDGVSDGRGRIVRRSVSLASDPVHGWVPVASGLRAGDLLVQEPSSAPIPGSRVRIRESWRDQVVHAGAASGGDR
ncbi:MAG: efflux RND transporter periplasmic adaptor subunit [Planctomycetes bacterium]|nr:efflux RND transporter periplasmic adaptor subunit [Planctomycetota bacterium]